MRRRRVALLTLLLLVGLVAVPIVLTWREVRQERLNHAMMTAIRQNDTTAALEALNQGADPNSHMAQGTDGPDAAREKRSFWQILNDQFHHRQPQSEGDVFNALERTLIQDDASGNALPENLLLLKALIAHGADVNDRDGEGNTALMIAAVRCRSQSVQLLLDHEAAVNARNTYGETALAKAVTASSNETVIHTLLQRGAEVNAQDMTGTTILQEAEMHDRREYLSLLKRYGAKK